LFILLVFLVFLVNLNYTWEMSTWLSFFINLHHYTGITLKVEQKQRKKKKCSTAESKIDPRGAESRTKTGKKEKMFYHRLQIRPMRPRK
ncbi:hypothetical protein ACTQ5Z_10580, partial [Ligilactobacillus ruminis]